MNRSEYESTWRRREFYYKILEWLVVGSLIACIPFGIGMAMWTNNGNWLWFCMTLIIFLS